MRLLSLSIAILSAIGPASISPALASSGDSAYPTLAALETRVATIGFRLTTANAGWCAARQPQFGWLWGDLRLYDATDRAAARAAYHTGDDDAVFVAAVAPGSPAAVAGVITGTPVVTIDDVAAPRGETDAPFARITAVERLFAARLPQSPVRISDGGKAIDITPVAGCVSDFRVEAIDRPMGVADGRLVLISKGLAEFATNDEDLAAAIAHELAHNVLRHRARLDAAGVDRGLGKQFGRNARLFKQTEVEADRLSVWLLAGAGYDPQAAVRFWTRFGQRKGKPLFQASTHPRWQDRVASFEAEIRDIDAARTAGRPLDPPLIAAAPPLE